MGTSYNFALAVRDAGAFSLLMLVPVPFIINLVGCFVTVPKFDQLTSRHQGTLDQILPVGGRWMRFIKYSVAVCFPRYVVRNERAIGIYSEFPYRRHASGWDIGLCAVFLAASFSLFLVAAVTFSIDALVALPQDRLA